jgi:hypothetical protein
MSSGSPNTSAWRASTNRGAGRAGSWAPAGSIAFATFNTAVLAAGSRSGAHRPAPFRSMQDRMPLSASSVVVAVRDQLVQPGRKAVILDLAAGTYYRLGEIGARVWALVQEPRRVGGARDILLAEYDVEPGRCERAVLQLLGSCRTPV